MIEDRGLTGRAAALQADGYSGKNSPSCRFRYIDGA